MADTVLQRLSTQSADTGPDSISTENIVGSVFRGAVGSMLNGAKQKTDQVDSESDTVADLSTRINPLIPFFANIAENVQTIAHHIGASVASMKDIKEDAKRAMERAAVAEEEAATEDAIVAPPPTPEEQQDACQCDGEGRPADKKKADEEASGFLKQFGGMDLEGIIGAFGSTIGEALFDVGFQAITKIFPAGIAISIAAAVGYGVYKYFTDTEFKNSVDDAFSSAKQFVVKNVFDPFINGVKKLVTGAIGFLGNFWETIQGLVSKAWNFVLDKATGAKNAVVSGAKAVSNKVTSFFGFGGEQKEPEPTGQAPVSPGVQMPTAKAAPVAEAAQPTAVSSPPTQPVSATATQVASSAPTTAPAAASGAQAEGDASKLETVVNKASGVDLGGIVPALKARLAGFAAEFQEMTGKKILITSGFRSSEKQRELYAKDPVHAAKPGVSPHEVGTAFDANSSTGDLDQAEQLGLFAKYKLFRPLWPPNRSGGVMEAWHVEPIERKALASAGDGGIVAGTSGGAISPGDGKATPIPPSPTAGQSIDTASIKNAAINEQRQRECGGSKTTLINAQQNVFTTMNFNPTIAGGRREDAPAFS